MYMDMGTSFLQVCYDACVEVREQLVAQQNGSVGKRICNHVRQLEFNPQDTQGGKKEQTPASCHLLTYT